MQFKQTMSENLQQMIEQPRKNTVKIFHDEEVRGETVYSCHHCYVDIFLESKILAYVPDDNAFFVKVRDSINYKQGYHTQIRCSNCSSYLGFIIYRNDYKENELRLKKIVPKFGFK